MPDVDLHVFGVEAVFHTLTPLLEFKLRVTASPVDAVINGLLLHAQIQLECPQRAYTSTEKSKLTELFGTPDQWGQTLRNRLWTHAHTTLGAFSESAECLLSVPCTYDLNVAAAKYLYALEAGDVPLLFLFSGSVFYSSAQGQLQVAPIPWDKECSYKLPVHAWRDLMERHYPNTAWVTLARDVFDELYAFKREAGCVSLDQAVQKLLVTASGTQRQPGGQDHRPEPRINKEELVP